MSLLIHDFFEVFFDIEPPAEFRSARAGIFGYTARYIKWIQL